MVDPVMLNGSKTGRSYERSAIEKWFGQSSLDPLTLRPLLDKTIIRNYNLRCSIQEYVAQNQAEFEKEFVTAVDSLDKEKAQKLHALGIPSPMTLDPPKGYSLLSRAARDNDIDKYDLLLSLGAKFKTNLEDYHLFYVSFPGSGASLVQLTHYGSNPLSAACIYEHTTMIKHIIQQESIQNLASEIFSCFITAILRGTDNVVECLLPYLDNSNLNRKVGFPYLGFQRPVTVLTAARFLKREKSSQLIESAFPKAIKITAVELLQRQVQDLTQQVSTLSTQLYHYQTRAAFFSLPVRNNVKKIEDVASQTAHRNKPL
jgi:hypothetical protein